MSRESDEKKEEEKNSDQ